MSGEGTLRSDMWMDALMRAAPRAHGRTNVQGEKSSCVMCRCGQACGDN